MEDKKIRKRCNDTDGRRACPLSVFVIFLPRIFLPALRHARPTRSLNIVEG